MREYFKPWRRKTGVATLLVACLFTGGWLRSLFVVDSFDCRLLPGNSVRSQVGKIYWHSGPNNSPIGEPLISWWVHPASTMKAREFEGQLGAVGFGWTREPTGTTVGIPYWSVVIPLTLLALRDLLDRPLKKETKADTIPETVA